MKKTSESTIKVLKIIMDALSKTGIKKPGDKIQKRAAKLAKEVVKAIADLDKKAKQTEQKKAKAIKKSNAGAVKKRPDKIKNKKASSDSKPFMRKKTGAEIKKAAPVAAGPKPLAEKPASKEKEKGKDNLKS